MGVPGSQLEIYTLGRFSVVRDGKPVATEWPSETIKVLFCSLLSPLDLYFTYDRICRSLLGVPATRSSQRRLLEELIRPLGAFLLKELGFNPVMTGPESIRIDQRSINSDAFLFNRTALEGLMVMSLENHALARVKLKKAESLYVGCYLPGMTGKIIDNTRKELESLHRASLMNIKCLLDHTYCLPRINPRSEKKCA
jgi:hypothetical protein